MLFGISLGKVWYYPRFISSNLGTVEVRIVNLWQYGYLNLGMGIGLKLDSAVVLYMCGHYILSSFRLVIHSPFNVSIAPVLHRISRFPE